MFGKKQKWPERIVPGFSRTADSRPFFIPKITKLEDKESMKQKFVSPIFGKAVKDEVSVPTDRSFFGDIDKKYDAFRTTKKLTKEEAKKRYGSTYYEFLIVNNEDRSKIHRQDLSVDELMKHPVKAEETPETPEVVAKAVE
ncbi:MAG: hypothetical protein PHW40_07635, partial [Candidatus Izemoplasmatales bacterium]|nr:hypothetical protein [Candidatus Izemoplasmatales bacterium]